MNIKYKQFIIIDPDNNILNSFTDGICKPVKNDICVGETENRHWRIENLNDDFIICKKWDGKKIIDRPQSEIDLILKDRQNMEFFNQSDKSFIRVLEDLIDTLIDKSMIKIDDLPTGAKEKYQERKEKR